MDNPTASELRQKTIAGVGWVTAAQFGRQALTLAISLLLARLLSPQEFGLVGMITVFTGFATLFGEMGLSAALIQREEVSEAHLSSVFWLNLVVGVALTLLLSSLAPALATFYGEPRLVPLTRLIALTFSLAALSLVQLSLLRRTMNFRLLAGIELASSVGAGIVALGLAIAGWGVWSLAWQLVLTSVLTALLAWRSSPWRPQPHLERAAIGNLIGFSGNLLGFNLLNYWTRNADNLLIGKFIGPDPLGLYARAYSLMLLPTTQVTNVLSRVMFPALSRVKDQPARAKRIYLQAVAAIALVTFPLMLGLFVVADPFVAAVLGPKWLTMTTTLRIFCLLGLTQSIANTAGWLYQSQGRTDWLLRWGLGSSAFTLASIALGIALGSVEAVAASYALASTLLAYPSLAIPGRLIGLTVSEVMRSVAGSLGCAATMAVAVWGLGQLLPPAWPPGAFLLVQVMAGVSLYAALLHLFKLEAYQTLRTLLREQVGRRARPLHQGS